jgi:hypothetical protein
MLGLRAMSIEASYTMICDMLSSRIGRGLSWLLRRELLQRSEDYITFIRLCPAVRISNVRSRKSGATREKLYL